MQISSSSGAEPAGLQISFGSATDRIRAKESEEQLHSKLNYIYQEIVKISIALEQIRNPLNLNTTKINYVKSASSSSGSDLDLIRGATNDADKALSSFAQFSSMSSGTITINSFDISIDVSADSLNDVISRIN
ncbi:MAG: hypothetical protein OEU55_15555, partial [Desulfobacterales bacterium]|nr:hypothetical protein [Desulfobacterales bacterium]